MSAQLHPDGDLLVEYSSGSLSPAMCVSISAHMHFCDSCRDENLRLTEIGGSLLSEVAPEALQTSALDEVFSKIDGEVDAAVIQQPVKTNEVQRGVELKSLPAMIQNLIPTREPKWKFLSPSLRAAAIPVGENSCELALHKIKAGGSTPSHDHNGREVIVVLKGSFSDEDGIYAEGDFIVHHPGEVHRPQASQNQECICLSVLEAPLKLTGALHRFLNPFFSFNPQ